MLDAAASAETLDGDTIAAPGPARPVPAIRAGVLRHLLTEGSWPVDPKGVRLRRLRVTGLLDLEAATLRCPLWLEECELDSAHPVEVSFATVPLLVITRCRLAGLSGNTLAVTANLDLRESVVSGAVLLPGARIGGALLCAGAKLGANREGNALAGQGMSVRLRSVSAPGSPPRARFCCPGSTSAASSTAGTPASA